VVEFSEVLEEITPSIFRVSLVHMDAEIQNMQPLHGAETQKKTSICICDFKLCTVSSW
jgi:hypothetical protein